MALLFVTRPYTKENKRRAVQELMDDALPDRDFYLLLIGAAFLAVCGIFTDSIPVLIASMIVAPLASPILALGLGIVSRDGRLIARSFGTLLISVILVPGFALLLTALIGHVQTDRVFISFASDPLVATLIALVAGAIAAYGLVRIKVGGAMTGIGIAVSLMPPLAASGLAVAVHDAVLFQETSILFGLNVIGILVGSIVVFALFRLDKNR